VEDAMSTEMPKLTEFLENAVGARLRKKVRKLTSEVKEKNLHQPLQAAADAAKWFEQTDLDNKSTDDESCQALIRLEQAREELDSAIDSIRPGLKGMRGTTSFPSGKNIVQEMQTLDSMFNEFRTAEAPTGQQVLIATTTEVELKDPEGAMWDFGRFEVVVDLDVFTQEARAEGSARLLRAYALTPNVCAENSSYTHPHVNGDSICTGGQEGKIKQSQEVSSIADLLEAVGAVLHTYNARSPYHPLESWGTAYGNCVDCGRAVRRESDAVLCGVCGGIICSECARVCSNCEEDLCGGCGTTCADCGEVFCGSGDCALEGCTGCGSLRCPSCLGDGLCKKCTERQATLEAARVRAEHQEEQMEFSQILLQPVGAEEDGKERKSTDSEPSSGGQGGFIDAA
jgi:hypothetical protein